MKHVIKRYSLLIFIFIFSAFSSAYAATSTSASSSTSVPTFTAGKDYQVLLSISSSAVAALPSEPGKISVIEFFSYGCPWCYRTQAVLEPWLQSQPKNVFFSRVPVVFEANWTILARAYYIASALGIEPKFTPAFFNAIHEQGLNVSNEQVLENFFAKQGVNKQDFDNAYNGSPVIDADMARGKALMQQYQVVAIPTFIVNGQYEVNPMMTNGDLNKLMQVLEFLVQKSQAAQTAAGH